MSPARPVVGVAASRLRPDGVQTIRSAIPQASSWFPSSAIQFSGSQSSRGLPPPPGLLAGFPEPQRLRAGRSVVRGGGLYSRALSASRLFFRKILFGAFFAPAGLRRAMIAILSGTGGALADPADRWSTLASDEISSWGRSDPGPRDGQDPRWTRKIGSQLTCFRTGRRSRRRSPSPPTCPRGDGRAAWAAPASPRRGHAAPSPRSA